MRGDDGAATTSAELRAHNLARLLRAVHDGGGRLTRAELTRQLSLARGTATVLVRELGRRRLITEHQAGEAAPRARGRPTGVPSAHAEGPVALAVDLRDDSFTVAAFELTGTCTVLDRRERDPVRDEPGAGLLAELAATLRSRCRQFGRRVAGVGIAVPSPVSGGTMVQPTLEEWRGLDVTGVLRPPGGAGPARPVLAGNDATLAGLAEARRGALRGVPVALHLHVATGIGGVLLADGRPVTGAHGSAGEFGHMPLAGGDRPCRCGAAGCWELEAGARGLLRAAGRPERGDRIEAAERVIAAAGTDPGCGRALARAATALGRGIGALVNAADPQAVGLSGLAASMYRAAPAAVAAGYTAALMRFRRPDPPALLPSALGDLGALTGASELVFDAFLTPAGLRTWPAPPGKPRDVPAAGW